MDKNEPLTFRESSMKINTYIKNMLKIIQSTTSPDKFSASSVSKISNSKNNSFSLPAGPAVSCPGATDACKDCYAMKNRHHFPNVQKKFAQNWNLLRKFEKSKNSDKAANVLLGMIPKGAKIFRIHESGDFHSQWVIEVWDKVVKARPDVKFWAYTRSFHLNFTPLTRHSNFALWASTDQYNEKVAKQFVRRFRKSGTKHAYGPWQHDKDLPPNSFVCPVTSGKMTLEGACDKCQLCVVKKRVNKNVVFLAH